MCGCGGVRQTARERGPGGEQSKGLGDGEGAGREGPGTEPQGPRAGRGEPGAGSREPGAGDRGGGTEGALPRWLQPKLGERRGGGGAERGSGAVRTRGGELGGRRRASCSCSRKSRLRGRGHVVPTPPLPRAAPGPGAERGRERGSGGAAGVEGVQALDATTLARSREGPKRAQGAQYSRYRAEERGFREKKRENGKWQSHGHRVAQSAPRRVGRTPPRAHRSPRGAL